ncbi:MAG: YidC/Oxa1 family membrane protein insertase [Patescibacteria group bacterium]
MFSFIWHTFFFDPIYNMLVFFVDTFPHGDVGLAIVATVLLVKLVLLPLSIKALQTQKIMREIEPKLKEIRETHKTDKEAQAKATMAIYKEAKLNPFASIFLVFLQIPIVIALYYAVYSGSAGIALPNINPAILYSFIPVPEAVSMIFLGLFDISQKSLVLALLAGVTQYLYVHLSMPKLPQKKEGVTPDLKEDFMRNMQLQMKYVMPVIITVIAYTISATIALYFLVSNLAAIAQEFYIRKHR